MQLFNRKRTLDFVSKNNVAAYASLAVIVLSIIIIVARGLNLGIDFTGGTLIEMGYEEVVNLEDIRGVLDSNGYDKTTVQYFGTTNKEVQIRLAPREGENPESLSENIASLLKGSDATAEVRRVDFVGPQVGEELREDGGLAMLYALFGILVYVALRFEWRFSIGAIIALVHDVIITVGFFALTQIEFDLTVLAAILAVIGYSLNDTIVLFDRIRENFMEVRKGETPVIVNQSINQTLSRTLMTSITTLLVLLALLFLGGEVIKAFAVALIVGVVVGTYSSIFVASNAVLRMGINKEDLMPKQDDDPELAEIP